MAAEGECGSAVSGKRSEAESIWSVVGGSDSEASGNCDSLCESVGPPSSWTGGVGGGSLGVSAMAELLRGGSEGREIFFPSLSVRSPVWYSTLYSPLPNLSMMS